VFKKLDKLILKAFIGPFLATFLIALFILVVQFFWLYIDEFVGKGIDGITLLQFVSYLTATLVPLALPLGILLSSIMTFGNLSESFELVAIKSAGIPLIRFMRPVFLMSGGLAITAFLFANYMIPVAELKMRTLLYDIRVAKPAFDIKEGVFYNKLDGYTMKIGKKVNDTLIKDILIYEHSYNLQDQVITAEEGVMTVSSDRRFLYFDLKNGWRYHEKGPAGTTQTEFYRLGFKNYKKVFDLSSFQLSKSADSTFKRYYKMLSLRQLTTVVDSLSKVSDSTLIASGNALSEIIGMDSASIKIKGNPVKIPNFSSIRSYIPDSLKRSVYAQAESKIGTLKSKAELMSYDHKEWQRQIRFHDLERHRKFTLSFACIVLFLIGAPLGSIIRKGGVGLPLVISVLFFIVFHILNTSGEKMVKEGVLPSFAGMWLSTFILVPIGIFLTYKAMQDSQLFNAELYYRFLSKFKLAAIIGQKEKK
jgi:lipopolysaccharide export system permease protein